ncbi:MAG: hypothetical protein JWM20_83 [Patescibacteria group bacterium]|nr:hypothetical protein [Patescibacteria group bacterium]
MRDQKEIEKCFELIAVFNIEVPKDYDHDTQIDSLFKKMEKEAEFTSESYQGDTWRKSCKDPSAVHDYDLKYNIDFNDANFVNASYKLVRGREYGVKIFLGVAPVTWEESIAFLKNTGATLTGAQGLTLAYQMEKDRFPDGRWLSSLDEKDTMWDGGAKSWGKRVPTCHHSVRDNSGAETFNFDFNYYNPFDDPKINTRDCLLVFYEI